jgi:hypothetical protein
VKKAYIILAHKNEQQVQRLVDTLDDNNSTFFLHVDLKVSNSEFKKVFEKDTRVHFVPRVKTEWGGFGLVEATLNAMSEVSKSGNFDKIILLSGQDYPIKSNEEIDQYFHDSKFNIFIDHFPLPNYKKWGSDGGMYRVNKYFFGLSWIEKYLAKAVNFLAMFIPAINRKIAKGMEPFSGSQWWAMDMPALNYILDYVATHPEYVKFHKHTFAADELFFQMILLNCEDESLRDNIANDNLRYMKWKTSDIAHPEILKVNDLTYIGKSNALFARKFDTGIDEEVINVIDDQLLNKLNTAS